MNSDRSDHATPRTLPLVALLMLGQASNEPGVLAFLRDAQDEGFGLDQPGDQALSDDEWERIATNRVEILLAAFRHSTRRTTTSAPYHVVIVGRSGDHPGAIVSVVGPGKKRHAISTCEAEFRRQHQLPTSVALVSKVVFTGPADEAEAVCRGFDQPSDNASSDAPS